MKKLIITIVLTLTIIIGLYFIWRNLPLTINRSSDIKLGEQIIEKIENYKKTNGLPDNNDWETLRKFGFRDKIDFLEPEYNKLNENSYELVYVEGFDGPYLLWNSKERIWKMNFPTIRKTQ